MNPNHCVSLELSKQLKEAGYKQEGEFCYSLVQYGIEGKKEWGLSKNSSMVGIPENSEIERCVTPLASEIMEMLPREIFLDGEFWELTIRKYEDMKKGYIVQYARRDISALSCSLFFDTNLCNALALMWLYLRKEKLI